MKKSDEKWEFKDDFRHIQKKDVPVPRNFKTSRYTASKFSYIPKMKPGQDTS